MIVPMTEEQAKEFGRYLREYKASLEAQAGYRKVSWTQLANELDMDDSLLAQLAEGKRTGMNWETTVKLRRGFGLRVLEILGIDLNAPPLFALGNGEGQGG